ncbi:MAG: ABC transporter permease [Chloroflexi bacterium SZAS-1]|jgi:oligopeptide transport system permease protein|nr:ABC transporter permease [Chloroflexi bacterium SZAS-1]HNP85924.1 ABC transporter permease [Kouleothrix sp.]
MATTLTNTNSVSDSVEQAFAQRAPRSLWSDARRRLLRNKAAVAALLYISFLIVVAIIAPLLALHNPLDIFQNNSYRQAAWITVPNRPEASGSWAFPLGTDAIGRDVWSRLVYGTRTSLVVGFVPMVFTLFLGTVIGLVSGFFGGAVDAFLMRFAEIVYSFPAFLFFIIVMTALKDTPIGKFWNGFVILFGALSLVGWVGVARLVRGQVLSLKEKEFIEAARAIGVRQHNILFKHLLPNSLGPIIISGAFIVPGAIIAEAVLSYLGIGLRPATDRNALFPVSWGNMILDGKAAITAQPWLMIAPAISIASITLAFTFIGDGLRDALDPREAN